MTRVAPKRARAKLMSTAGGIRVVIPMRRNWSRIFFLAIWLSFWAFGEVTAIRHLVDGARGGAALFFFVWLAGWTLGGAFAIVALAWNLAGWEVITAAGRTLSVRREALGIGRTWKFNAGQVRNLGLAWEWFDPSSRQLDPFGPIPTRISFALRYWGFRSGIIAFDYGARRHRFGAGIDEAEALGIIEELRSRLAAVE